MESRAGNGLWCVGRAFRKEYSVACGENVFRSARDKGVWGGQVDAFGHYGLRTVCCHAVDFIWPHFIATMEDFSCTGPAGLHLACSSPPRSKGQKSREEVQSCRQGILLPHDYR